MARLETIGEGAWAAELPHDFLGVPVGTRMAVFRLDGGGLLLYSPVAIDDGLRAELDALGPVEQIVAPNPYHHVYLPGAAAAFPEAKIWASPRLPERQPELRIDGLVGPGKGPWHPAVEHLVVEGIPLLPETVMFHRPSATLAVADLLAWIPDADSRLLRTYARLEGVREPAVPRLVRSLARRRPPFLASLERILEWPVERVVLAHGRPIPSGAGRELRRAFREAGAAV